MNNVPSGAVVDAVVLSDFMNGEAVAVRLAQLLNLLLRQAGVGMRSAFWKLAAASPLANAINGVGASVADKKMFRSDARRIIAMMKYEHIVSNRAVGKGVRESVRPDVALFDGEIPVTVLVASGSPQPTPGSLIDLSPEPLHGCGQATTLEPTGVATEFNLPARYTGRDCVEAFPAPQTHSVMKSFVYTLTSHGMNLQHRFELWSGSFKCLPHLFGPFCILAHKRA